MTLEKQDVKSGDPASIDLDSGLQKHSSVETAKSSHR